MMPPKKSGADLSGAKILLVEDEFYLAIDMKEQIEDAGGTVLGPCKDSIAAIEHIEEGPDCAIVDINLGQGPSFAIAEVLAERSVPFLFLTGYDAATIPPRFAEVECIQKPASAPRVIDAVVVAP